MGMDSPRQVKTLEVQSQNLAAQLKVYEDWNDKLHTLIKKERESHRADMQRAAAVEADLRQQLRAALVGERGRSAANSGEKVPPATVAAAEAERRRQEELHR